MGENLRAKRILHILVHYKTPVQTENFLRESLRQSGSEFVRFIIVNNSAQAPEDLTFKHLESEQVQVLSCPDNPGYFPGAERAFRMAKAAEGFDWVLLSNTDMHWAQNNAYSELLGYSVKPREGVFGPSIQSQLFGRETNPLLFQRPKRTKIIFLSLVYSFYPLSFAYHLLNSVKSSFFQNRKFESEASLQVYALHGAFLIFYRSFFAAGGNLSHPIPLYAEENNIAEQCIKLGIQPRVLQQMRVLHHEAGSQDRLWQRIGLSVQKFRHKRESLRYLRELYNAKET